MNLVIGPEKYLKEIPSKLVNWARQTGIRKSAQIKGSGSKCKYAWLDEQNACPVNVNCSLAIALYLDDKQNVKTKGLFSEMTKESVQPNIIV